jgi:phosphoribosylglycinamide formyltransferase-1
MQNKLRPIRVAAFASGRGTNLDAILQSITEGKLAAEVVLVISNRSNAGALEIAGQFGIPAFHLSQKQFEDAPAYENYLSSLLSDHGTELIALAGYLKLVPACIIRQYKNRVLNIHPALLPSFGGAGMYGHFVHEAVLSFGCKVSGATVHLVDEQYDTGAPILQRCVPVLDDDTPDSLAARVLQIEHQIYSEAIQLFAENRVIVDGRRVKILPETCSFDQRFYDSF